MFFIYVIKSQSSNKLYIGQTHDLQTRISQHNGVGKFTQGYTRGKGPWILVYTEEYTTRSEAVLREKFFKTGRGRDFLKTKLMVESALAD